MRAESRQVKLLVKTTDNYPEPKPQQIQNVLDTPMATFAQVYAMIDCSMVEVVYLHSYDDGKWIMLIDEDGKIKGKPLNRIATLMAGPELQSHDVIVGDAIVCRMEDMT